MASLLVPARRFTVLGTSRIPFEIPAEELFAIPPMGGVALPSDPFESDATALFLDRATSVAGAYALTEHNAKTLGEICDVLHGLPLAIELAASWIPRPVTARPARSSSASPHRLWPRTPRSSRSVIAALR